MAWPGGIKWRCAVAVIMAMATARVEAAETNDSFTNAVVLPFAAILFTSNADATAESREPAHAVQ